MRKFLALILSAAILFTLAGCSAGKKDSSEEKKEETSVRQEEKSADADAAAEVPEDEVKPAALVPEETVTLPDSSSEFSAALARQTLTLCTGHQQEREAKLLTDAGFEVVSQVHYDKSAADISHTCAYSIGKKQIVYKGETRTLIVTAIRGTDGGEWYSNFDFAPSHSSDTVYAENFLLCAEDVYSGLESVLAAETEPLVLVCGHSRGAACANLLGLLLNRGYGNENVFVYTFATPTTVRSGAVDTDCGNIFNIINPADVVTKVPLAAWGYGRAGQDIILPGSSDTSQRLDGLAGALWSVAPTISQYYTQRHSLTEPGLSEDGMTAFELMTALISSFSGGDGTGADMGGISQESDLWVIIEAAKMLSAVGLQQHMPLTYQALMAARSAVAAFLPAE